MLDWIFEGIVGWVGSIVSQLMDAVSGLFLEALGTDMTAMEEYFPFVTKAYDVMQITAWAILILITVAQRLLVPAGFSIEVEVKYSAPRCHMIPPHNDYFSLLYSRQ